MPVATQSPAAGQEMSSTESLWLAAGSEPGGNGTVSAAAEAAQTADSAASAQRHASSLRAEFMNPPIVLRSFTRPPVDRRAGHSSTLPDKVRRHPRLASVARTTHLRAGDPGWGSPP